MSVFRSEPFDGIDGHKPSSPAAGLRRAAFSATLGERLGAALASAVRQNDVEILTDGVTVWINVQGGNLARFGRNGIDIHRMPMEQALGGQCLYCTHEPVTAADWEMFKTQMRKLHGITVDDRYKPTKLGVAP